MGALEAAWRHWWTGWGLSPATAVAAGSALLGTAAVTWVLAGRSERFLERGRGARAAAVSFAVAVAAAILALGTHFQDTRNVTGTYVTTGCFLGLIAGVQACSLSLSRKRKKAARTATRPHVPYGGPR